MEGNQTSEGEGALGALGAQGALEAQGALGTPGTLGTLGVQDPTCLADAVRGRRGPSPKATSSAHTRWQSKRQAFTAVTEGAAGADLRANFAPEARAEGVTLAPGARALVPTGLRLAIPQGYEVQLRPRSGLALRHGITLPNSPGTIDSDYRGPLGVIVMNAGEAAFHIEHGARIAQMVVAPVVQARFEAVEALEDTARGEGGFGSTGRV